MIVNSKLADITATPAVSGINANFLQPSLKRARIEVDDTSPHHTIDIDRELADALTERPSRFRPWRDIWSAGHGVGSITDIPSVEQLVARLRNEYYAAITAQHQKINYLTS
jgi:nitronate monooxygenase